MGGGSAGLKLLLFPSIPGSAVCAFYMEEVEQVFTGRFKEQRSGDLSWTAVPDEQVPRPRWVELGPGLLPVCRRVLIRVPLLSRPGTCAGDGAAAHLTSSVQFPDETLAFIKSYPLMDEAVPAVNHRPVFTRTSSRCVSFQDLPGPPRTPQDPSHPAVWFRQVQTDPDRCGRLSRTRQGPHRDVPGLRGRQNPEAGVQRQRGGPAAGGHPRLRPVQVRTAAGAPPQQRF